MRKNSQKGLRKLSKILLKAGPASTNKLGSIAFLGEPALPENLKKQHSK